MSRNAPAAISATNTAATATTICDAIELGRVLDELLARYPEGVIVERYIAGTDIRVSRIDGVACLSTADEESVASGEEDRKLGPVGRSVKSSQ